MFHTADLICKFWLDNLIVNIIFFYESLLANNHSNLASAVVPPLVRPAHCDMQLMPVRICLTG
jgi:hypothetical protein